MFLPIRGVLAFFVTGWWGVAPMQVLGGSGLASIALWLAFGATVKKS